MAQRKHPDRPYVRHIMTEREVKERMSSGCPACGGKLVARQGTHTDPETGNKRVSGSFIGCSNYGHGCDASYSMSFDRERVESWYVEGGRDA